MADISKPSDASMILVMGVTGSGKSYFVNQLAGRKVIAESKKLDSCPTHCQLVPIEVGKSKFLLIDTPGFDDSHRSDTEILTEISTLLSVQYKLGISLKGVIYLHRITDNRYQGASVRTLKIFKEICGKRCLKNVILASNRWDEVEESVGSDREDRLREHFWKYMITHWVNYDSILWRSGLCSSNGQSAVGKLKHCVRHPETDCRRGQDSGPDKRRCFD